MTDPTQPPNQPTQAQLPAAPGAPAASNRAAALANPAGAGSRVASAVRPNVANVVNAGGGLAPTTHGSSGQVPYLTGTRLADQLNAQCLACDPKTVANPKVKILKRAQLISFLENALRDAANAAGQSAQAAQALRDCSDRVQQLEAALQSAEARAAKAEADAGGALSELEKLRAENEQLRADAKRHELDARTLRAQLRQMEGDLATLDALRQDVANKEKIIKQKEVSLHEAHQVLVEKGLQEVDVWVKRTEVQRARIDEYEFNEDFYHAFAMPDTQNLHRLLHDSESRTENLKKAIAGMPQGVTQAITGPAMAMVQAQLDIAVRARRAIADYERSLQEMNTGKGSLERIVNLALAIGAIQMFVELVRMLNFGLQMSMHGLKTSRG